MLLLILRRRQGLEKRELQSVDVTGYVVAAAADEVEQFACLDHRMNALLQGDMKRLLVSKLEKEGVVSPSQIVAEFRQNM